MRTCGSCTLCCKVLAIPEIAKPASQWCPSCVKGKGCKIYETRPDPCRAFSCLWLQREEFPEAMRPDRSHVVLSTNETGDTIVAHVDPGYSGAWTAPSIMFVLEGLASASPRKASVVVIGPEKRVLVSPDGSTRHASGTTRL